MTVLRDRMERPGPKPSEGYEPERPKLESLSSIWDDREEEETEGGGEEACLRQTQEKLDQLLEEMKQLRIELIEAQLETQFLLTQKDCPRKECPPESAPEPDPVPPPRKSSLLERLGRAFLLSPVLLWAGWVLAKATQWFFGPWPWPGSAVLSCIACFLLGLLLILAGRFAPDPWDLVDALLAEPPDGEDEEESWDSSDLFGR